MEHNLDLQPMSTWLPNLSRPVIISGPCSAETEEQVLATCKALADTKKVDILRAGIWKPRTRPNNFEGIGVEGLKWMQKAKALTGLPTTVEVATAQHVHEALKHGIDILWIGARTTVNPFSVQEIADELRGVDIPVLIKNPINADLQLWIGAIERIYQSGVKEIGAIHRGFAKYGEKKYRNSPQWQLPIELRRIIPGIPLICDPSHIAGNRELLFDVAQEALDLSYDGLMIESHVTPDEAWSDAKQQVTPQRLHEMIDAFVLRKDISSAEKSPSALDEFRNQIDKYDEEILELFAQRMGVANKIGVFKKEHNLTILQTKRWDEIVKKIMSKAEPMGLSEEFVERYLKAVHQESINHQNKVMKND